MIETIIAGALVVVAALFSGRHLVREVFTGKQPCSGCGDDCPLAKACACKGEPRDAQEKAPVGCRVVGDRAG